MTIIIIIALFLLGMFLGAQLIAALYGVIDLWYTIKTAYLSVIKGILGWSVVIAALTLFLGETYRPALMWGLAAFAGCHVATFGLTTFIARMATRPVKNEGA